MEDTFGGGGIWEDGLVVGIGFSCDDDGFSCDDDGFSEDDEGFSDDDDGFSCDDDGIIDEGLNWIVLL